MQGLCRCAQVCRTWRDITEDAKLWSKVGGGCRKGGWGCGSGSGRPVGRARVVGGWSHVLQVAGTILL